MIYRLLLDLALTVRSTPVLSFAVCFSRRFKRFRGKASSSVDFSPFSYIIFKGVKTHKGTGKAGTTIYPSASADGKRESAT